MIKFLKLKEQIQGLEKTLQKPDTFNPPLKVITLIECQEAIEVLFSGAKVMGVPQMLEWKLAENMTRPNS